MKAEKNKGMIQQQNQLFRQIIFGGIIGAFLFLTSVSFAQTPPRQLLNDHVPEIISHLTPIGQVAATKHLDLAIGLPLRNQAELDDFLKEVSDPSSPNYRHYLTPEQFAEKFGPTEQDYQAVEKFFQTNGFTIAGTSPNRMLLDVNGSVADIERVFHVTLRMYRHPTENRTFYAPDVEPSIDLSNSILHVSGLDNFSLPRPKIIQKIPLTESNKTVISHAGSFGSGGLYAGNDFRAAYLPGIPTNQLSGAGQVLGLLEFDGYYSNDIVKYESESGLPRVALTNVAVSGGVSSPGGDNGEVALDIEVAIAMAPGLSKIVVYEASNGTSWPTILNAIANDTTNFPQQISCSWGNNTPGSPDTSSENIFKQMRAQGQSFFNASGDTNAFIGGVPFPSESTNITQVGGTTLSTTGPNGVWTYETVWDWGGITGLSGAIGSSGGVSANFKIPLWQQGISTNANLGSTTMRNVPDVAMTADYILSVADNGTNYYTAGTSAAAPLWAAFIALVNQQALAGGKPVVGFINPAIYAIGKSANYLSDFNDIVTGNNFWSSSTNKFPAVPGYDLCTGWGSPAGDNLIDALSGVSDSMAVAPGKGFVAFGAAGGPFTTTAQSFFLTNSGVASLDWSLVNTSLWLTASAASGTLTPGGTGTNVTMSLNAAACALTPGIYTANVLFTNQTTHASRDRQFALLIGQQLIQNRGFENGELSYWAQTGVGSGTFNGYNYDFADDGSTASPGIKPHSGTYLAVFGAGNEPGFISQTIPTVPGQTYLLSFWLTNPVSGSTEQFSVNWNTNTVFNLLNPGKLNWTNPIIQVTATSSNTVLQFAVRNDPFYFGLDDVSLLPIPLPSFNTAFQTNGTFVFNWNSLSGIQYAVQTSTNLAQTNWLNLSTNTANDFTLSFTNSITNQSQFYRIRRLP